MCSVQVIETETFMKLLDKSEAHRRGVGCIGRWKIGEGRIEALGNPYRGKLAFHYNVKEKKAKQALT